MGDEAITERLRRIDRSPSDLFVACPPQVLEFCHSARTPDERVRYREEIYIACVCDLQHEFVAPSHHRHGAR
ncbi:PIN domain nuclease [Tsukamurella sputi]|uniref:PIN domain nuclease n=1 Tax=Tsukamurella sputi TaxID=2591848 RepID=A0A5C5RLG1_9ACTN|nr:PIN domain nuclease [Tsukamurella sputi]